jgi:hypothetical protein
MRGLGLSILLSSSTALAEMPAPPPETPRQVTVTMSPIHLVFPIVEAMVEFQPAPHFGVAVLGALGRVTDKNTDLSGTAMEIGGQVVYYPMHRFRGLHVGAEVLYVNISDIDLDSSATGEGLAVGPLVGYKVLTRSGFTFLAQGGAQVAVIRAETTNQMASERKVFPLVNLNLGWSF